MVCFEKMSELAEIVEGVAGTQTVEGVVVGQKAVEFGALEQEIVEQDVVAL